MKFEIIHKTSYRYNRPVFLEPHTLRLQPRCSGFQHLTDYQWRIDPMPAGSSQSLEIDGNLTTLLWFEGLSDSLVIESHAKVSTRYQNPFDFILVDRAEQLPVNYLEPIKAYIAPYIAPLGSSTTVERFAREIANQSEWKTLRFLTALNREIFTSCRQTVRKQGEPRPAEETLERKRGSGHELALLFIEACRYVGIAARFVTGYQELTGAKKQSYLHAWSEVYLPGAGWRGYDPSQGLAVTDRHIALAAAGIPALAAPVVGSYRGNAVTSQLKVEIDLKVLED